MWKQLQEQAQQIFWSEFSTKHSNTDSILFFKTSFLELSAIGRYF